MFQKTSGLFRRDSRFISRDSIPAKRFFFTSPALVWGIGSVPEIRPLDSLFDRHTKRH
jgi:hypothetical protein